MNHPASPLRTLAALVAWVDSTGVTRMPAFSGMDTRPLEDARNLINLAGGHETVARCACSVAGVRHWECNAGCKEEQAGWPVALRAAVEHACEQLQAGAAPWNVRNRLIDALEGRGPANPLPMHGTRIDGDELRRALAAIAIVTQDEGYDVIRRASVLEIVDRRIRSAETGEPC